CSALSARHGWYMVRDHSGWLVVGASRTRVRAILGVAPAIHLKLERQLATARDVLRHLLDGVRRLERTVAVAVLASAQAHLQQVRRAEYDLLALHAFAERHVLDVRVEVPGALREAPLPPVELDADDLERRVSADRLELLWPSLGGHEVL